MHRATDFIIREATVRDAEPMCRVHIAAIDETCAADYDAKTIEGWLANKVPESYEQAMVEFGEHMFVAERDGVVIGFASLLDDCIRALFIHPNAGRQGVGAALLSAIEEYAAGIGHSSLTLSSTFTAERFYQSHGWKSGDRLIQMSSDTPVQCISMTKQLPVQNERKLLQRIAL